MILADKIIKLRKKNGWSQEELAEKMNVSRQAVSKWEGAQTIPDLEKILQLSTLFGVTTDYLLKDESEDEEFTDDPSDERLRQISVEEATAYLAQRKRASKKIALATFLCILSPIPLLILGVASEVMAWSISESFAGACGLFALFAFVLIATPIFIHCGFQNEPYAFLDKGEPFTLLYGVSGIVRERQKQYQPTYRMQNILATCICIFSPIPLLCGAFTDNDFLIVIMLTLTMAIAGVGAAIFIIAGVQWESMQKLLKEGDYKPQKNKKKKNKLKETLGWAYWGILTAAFLIIWSFVSSDWRIAGLIFAVGGVLFPVYLSICDLIIEHNHKSE